MIFTDRTIIVKNGTSSIDSTIVLYRGDREVEIRFTLNEGTPFKFGSGTSSNIIEKTEATYGQLVIKTPGNLPPIFSEVTPTIGGKIIFMITAEMIDETTEVGNYTFQIRLLDDNMESRATLPEVKNGIEIREPIASEDTTNEVGVATVGYALTTAGTTEDAFDSQGNYNKTTWGTGDRITAAKLNKMEAAIDGVNKKVASGGTVDLSGYVTKETGNASQIIFADGQTFQAKLDAGMLKGDPGEQGPQGIQGPKGDSGVDSIDDTTASATTTYSSNKIETIKEGLGSQIKDKANNIDLEVQRRRIDSFTALAEGSTTGDAELIDARIGYNGVTYSSAGNAIREQVSPIFDSISVWKEIDANSVQTGLVDLNNKSVYKDEHSCFIKVFIPSPVKKIKVSGKSANATYNFGLGAFYDSNDSLIEKFGNQNETAYVDLELNVPGNTAYILVNQKGTISSNYNKIKIFYIAQKIAEKIDIIEDKVKTFEERFQDAAGLLDNVEFSVFAKWGVIGDSLSVGYTTDTDGKAYGRNIYYSWGQFLARKIGNTCLNFGRSGIDSKGWMSDGYGYPRLINPDNLCQCYIIALGANDAANVATVPIGTISDIDFNNMDNNADTVYGWYAKVINAVKTTAPKAPIFLFTIPYPRNTDANVRAINDMVRELVTNNNFSNLYLVDLDANYNDYFKSGKMYNMIGNTGWHLTALGYLYKSRVIEMALSKVMYDNYQHFQNVPFIPYGSAEKLD